MHHDCHTDDEAPSCLPSHGSDQPPPTGVPVSTRSRSSSNNNEEPVTITSSTASRYQKEPQEEDDVVQLLYTRRSPSDENAAVSYEKKKNPGTSMQGKGCWECQTQRSNDGPCPHGGEKKDHEDQEVEWIPPPPPMVHPKRNDQHCWEQIRTLFQYQRHSLHIAVSKVAAITGYHPYSNIPELLLDLVYQGSIGKRLLQHDLQLLGLSLQSSEVIWLQLISQAGIHSTDVKQAIQETIQMKKGKGKKINSIQQANELKDRIMKNKDVIKQLKPQELQFLGDGIRNAIDTSYGISNEDDALNWYEKHYCGTIVRERNAQIRCWPFVRSEDYYNVDTSTKTTDAITSTSNTRIVDLRDSAMEGIIEEIPNDAKISIRSHSVVPARDAYIMWNRPDHEELSSSASSMSVAFDRPTKRTMISSEPLVHPSNAMMSTTSDLFNDATIMKSNTTIHYPYFSILGSVDGIRDEWYPVRKEQIITSTERDCNNNDNNNDNEIELMENDDDMDIWCSRSVVVECKHRMARLRTTIPLFEQIQTMVYCLMYNYDQADIVQVLRSRKKEYTPAEEKKILIVPDNTNNDNQTGQTTDQDDQAKFSDDSSIIATNSQSTRGKMTSTVIPVISVHRISLDDPIMRHRENWTEVILPRLRSFVDAVYDIRSDDGKRYQLIQSVCVDQTTQDASRRDAWKLLHEHCPWLESCDTAYCYKP